MVISVENPNSQRYIAANGIKAYVAHFTRQGLLFLKEYQKSPRLLTPIEVSCLCQNESVSVWLGLKG